MDARVLGYLQAGGVGVMNRAMALADARSILIDFGRDIAGICKELRLDGCQLSVDVDESPSQVRFVGFDARGDICVSFSVKLPTEQEG